MRLLDNTTRECLYPAYMGDEHQELEIARQYAETHPELYEQILEKNVNSDKEEQMIKVGLEALEKIKGHTEVRSKIALLTAKYACDIDKPEIYEYCWIAAFQSDKSILNYMRVRFLVQDWSKYEELVLQNCRFVPKTEQTQHCMLLFWN